MENALVFCALLSVDEIFVLVFIVLVVDEVDASLLVGILDGVPSSLTKDIVDPCLDGVPCRLTGRDPPGVMLERIGIDVARRDDSGVLRSENVLSLSESVRVFDDRSADYLICRESESSVC